MKVFVYHGSQNVSQAKHVSVAQLHLPFATSSSFVVSDGMLRALPAFFFFLLLLRRNLNFFTEYRNPFGTLTHHLQWWGFCRQVETGIRLTQCLV